MRQIPVIGFSGYSGSGKTTLVERLIPVLKQRGIRSAVIKHDVHGLSVDSPGKDSDRFSRAGAEAVIVNGPGQTAAFIHHELNWEEAAALAGDVDLIIIEGYKHGSFTKIGICRQANGKGFTEDLSRFCAVATDLPDVKAGCPVFSLDDIEGIVGFIMQNMNDFTHFDADGRARMVNVGEKDITRRTAVAGVSVLVSRETFDLIRTGGMKKGDVLTVAQIAGIMGAKRTPDLIPMCHPIAISGAKLRLSLNEERLSVDIESEVSCEGRTGVEMEALTAASVAALTVYDMCKAVQKDMIIDRLRLIEKTGGVHGDYHREEETK